jgi:hypothetical protein
MNYESMHKEELLDILAELGQGVVNGNASKESLIARINELKGNSPAPPAPEPEDPEEDEDKPRGIFG